MAWASARLDRLRKIVAQLVREGITPRHSLFGTKVAQIACGELGLSTRTAREYAKSLAMGWRYRWIPYVKGSPYLEKEVIEDWIKKHSRKLS